MKLGRIAVASADGEVPRLVVVEPAKERVIDLVTAESARLQRRGATADAALRVARALFPSSMSAAIALGDSFLDAAAEATESVDERAVQPLSGVRLLSPLDPPLIRDFSAFADHVRAMQKRMNKPFPPVWLELPVYFKINPSTVIGPEDEVYWPQYTERMDYELELGLVVGQPGRDVLPETALDHLFGVTILNDFSARDIQAQEMSFAFGPSKGKDFATALGPWIVTRDELDLGALTLTARVNGDEWSRAESGSITWSIAELIAFASWGEPILPGELLGSGTVGTGAGSEHGRSLNPGDVVELEISGVGVLRNRIGRPEPRTWSPEKRRIDVD